MAKIEARFEREMEVGVPLWLEVATRSGDISVHGGEDGKLRVTSEFEVRAGFAGRSRGTGPHDQGRPSY